MRTTRSATLPRATGWITYQYRSPSRIVGGLPFRLGDRIVARVDLKADRKNGKLLALSTHYEADADQPEAESALRDELGRLAAWLGLDAVVYG